MLLPYLLIVGGGYIPTRAGFALLPFSILIGTAPRFAGRRSERIGPRWPLTIGPIVAGVVFALMATIDPGARCWSNVLPGVVVIALGMTGAVAPLLTSVLLSVHDRHIGIASGLDSAIARTGGLIAIGGKRR